MFGVAVGAGVGIAVGVGFGAAGLEVEGRRGVWPATTRNIEMAANAARMILIFDECINKNRNAESRRILKFGPR